MTRLRPLGQSGGSDGLSVITAGGVRAAMQTSPSPALERMGGMRGAWRRLTTVGPCVSWSWCDTDILAGY